MRYIIRDSRQYRWGTWLGINILVPIEELLERVQTWAFAEWRWRADWQG